MTDLLAPSPTTSTFDAGLGSQVPRVRNVPAYSRGYGDEVVDFMSEIGRPLDPWQDMITRDAHGVRDDGLWAAYELMLLLARQNGKGGVTEAIELGGLFLFHEPLILHSAHQFKTSTSAFRRLIDIIDGSDWLTRRVKMISRSKGDESIELTRAAGGGRLQFVARTLGSGRGLTGSKNIFDEAAWLTVGQYAAQTPTLATIPNPQIIYTSTPPDEDVGPMPEDAMLPSVRKRGLQGADRIAFYEWSPQSGYDRTDRRVWRECNPAIGIRIAEWFLLQQLDAFVSAGRPEKFDTEHLGLWPDDEGRQWQVITEAQWQLKPCRATMADPVAIGVDVTPDRTWSGIGAAGHFADGRLLDLVEHRPGTRWVIPRLKELDKKHKPCVIVTSDRALADEAEQNGLEVYRAGSGDMASAAAMTYSGIVEGDVWHLGQAEVDSAVAGATKRTLGDGWAWDRRSVSVNICPLVATSLALWGLATPRVQKPILEPFMLTGD